LITLILKKIRVLLPNEVKNILRLVLKSIKQIFFKFFLMRVRFHHKVALRKVREKAKNGVKIKVVFLLIHDSVWKYDGLYKLMLQDERFEPVIVVCPYIIYGEEVMHSTMNQAYNSFKNKGYNVIKTYNEKTGEWLDVKQEIEPDIVFFTNPWPLTKEKYYIHEYLNTITCYVPYFYQVTKHLEENFGGSLQNIVWRVFYESRIHLSYAIKYSNNDARNVLITGYPGLDPILLKTEVKDDPWKIKDRKFKRIIWAPHHTIIGQDAGLGLSNFLQYFAFFQNLVSNNTLEIQIAFKPHPLLKSKLYKNNDWGVSKTDEYYSFWEKNDKGLLVEGEYVNLFLTSDALIHDSGSFTIEFLATQKPVLYLLNSFLQLASLNSFGVKAVDCHYKASNTREIEYFIKDVIINGNDHMKKERISFIERHLILQDNITASQRIYNHIVSQII